MRNAPGWIAMGCAWWVAAGGCAPQQRAVRHYEQGRLLAERGQPEAALQELAKAVKADPKLSVAYAAAGDIHRRHGSFAQAREWYEKACQTSPYAFRAHYNLGVTYQKLAQAAEAIETFEGYVRLAVRIYLRAVMLEPNDFDTNLNLSACYFQLGQESLAEHYCRQAARLDDRRPEAFTNLGIILADQGRLDEAVTAYKTSLELDVHQPVLLVNLGSTYMRQGLLRSARHSLEAAVEQDPKDARGWEMLGACCYHTGDLNRCREAYEAAVALDPRSPAAHRGAGILYMRWYLTDSREEALRRQALEAWRRSLALDPSQEDLERLLRKYAGQSAVPMATGVQ